MTFPRNDGCCFTIYSIMWSCIHLPLKISSFFSLANSVRLLFFPHHAQMQLLNCSIAVVLKLIMKYNRNRFISICSTHFSVENASLGRTSSLSTMTFAEVLSLSIGKLCMGISALQREFHFGCQASCCSYHRHNVFFFY